MVGWRVPTSQAWGVALLGAWIEAIVCAEQTGGCRHMQVELLVMFSDGLVVRQAENVLHRVLDHLDQAVAA